MGSGITKTANNTTAVLRQQEKMNVAAKLVIPALQEGEAGSW